MASTRQNRGPGSQHLAAAAFPKAACPFTGKGSHTKERCRVTPHTQSSRIASPETQLLLGWPQKITATGALVKKSAMTDTVESGAWQMPPRKFSSQVRGPPDVRAAQVLASEGWETHGVQGRSTALRERCGPRDVKNAGSSEFIFCSAPSRGHLVCTVRVIFVSTHCKTETNVTER